MQYLIGILVILYIIFVPVIAHDADIERSCATKGEFKLRLGPVIKCEIKHKTG